MSAARLLQLHRNRPPEPKLRAPGKGRFASVVGQLGLLWGASDPTRTRERCLVTEIRISLSALRNSPAARLLQRYRNRPPEPKSRAPGKGGFASVVGQLGLLWGASDPTRTRERRLVTEIKFSLSALRKLSAARLLQRYRNRISGSQTAPPKPKSRAPGKGRSVGVVGQLGLRWGASVATRTRERRLVTKIKFSLSALKIS